ncbi:MAG: hypothetical protein RL701_2754 [Pseudomonadota bacterium]
MQHLLDFIHEHTQEDQLYLVASTPSGELEFLWQSRVARNQWQIRPMRCEGPWHLIDRSEVIAVLTARNADMASVECELRSIVMTQIAAANMVLRAATSLLGADVVERAVLAHEAFVYELTDFVEQLAPRAKPATRDRPKLSVVAGEGGQTSARSGHLRVVM